MRTPGPTITITLTGGRQLQEFTRFGLKALRSVDPTKPSHRCLSGTLLRAAGALVPPMNQPVTYALPADAPAVYVYGQSSSGAAQDVHAVLLPESGAQVALPLTVATDEKRLEVARLVGLLEAAEWMVASTMPENPHSYSKMDTWASEADFEFAVRAIRRYGRRQPYIPPGETAVAYRETVFEYGTHFVWTGWVDPAFLAQTGGWINRKAVLTPVEARVVDQTLLAHDARVLEVPPLPDGFADISDAHTNRFLHAGVRLFGWSDPPTDRRPKAARHAR